MDIQELRAAAERYRQARAIKDRPLLVDSHRLADYACDELAKVREDDGELVDYNWLVSVGFGEPTINGSSILVPALGDGDPVECFISQESDGGWICALLQSSRDDHAATHIVCLTGRVFRTRHDVRRLAEVLGIKLKEGSESNVTS